MSSSLTHRFFSRSLPRDYIRRRRAVRRMTTAFFVVMLSVVVAYAIVHYSGPAAFSPPHP